MKTVVPSLQMKLPGHGHCLGSVICPHPMQMHSVPHRRFLTRMWWYPHPHGYWEEVEGCIERTKTYSPVGIHGIHELLGGDKVGSGLG